jgi:hypothetical protein
MYNFTILDDFYANITSSFDLTLAIFLENIQKNGTIYLGDGIHKVAISHSTISLCAISPTTSISFQLLQTRVVVLVSS